MIIKPYIFSTSPRSRFDIRSARGLLLYIKIYTTLTLDGMFINHIGEKKRNERIIRYHLSIRIYFGGPVSPFPPPVRHRRSTHTRYVRRTRIS